MFHKFFPKKERESIAGHLMVDIHSHLLPGVDDGAESTSAAINILRFFDKAGYKKVITTPHIYPEVYDNSEEKIIGSFEKFSEQLERHNLSITMEVAAEYFISHEFQSKICEKSLLTIGNNLVLFEMPYMNKPHQFKEVVFQLISNGYTPLLAHPERYSFFQEDYDDLKKVKESGVLLQVNLSSFTGAYSVPAKKLAFKLWKNNLIDFLGSDCHNFKQTEVLQEALHHKIFKDIAQKNLKNSLLV